MKRRPAAAQPRSFLIVLLILLGVGIESTSLAFSLLSSTLFCSLLSECTVYHPLRGIRVGGIVLVVVEGIGISVGKVWLVFVEVGCHWESRVGVKRIWNDTT